MCSCGCDATPTGWTNLHDARPESAGTYEVLTVAGRNVQAEYDGEQFVGLPDCGVVCWRAQQ